MKYTLIVKICNQDFFDAKYVDFKASNFDDALSKAKKLLGKDSFDFLDPDTDYDIDEAFIVPIEETFVLPTDIWQEEILKEKEKEVDRINEERELKELERLKAKYENKIS